MSGAPAKGTKSLLKFYTDGLKIDVLLNLSKKTSKVIQWNYSLYFLIGAYVDNLRDGDKINVHFWLDLFTPGFVKKPRRS